MLLFEIMLRTSFQASVLTLIVLAMTLIFRNRIGAKWRFLFWSLVMLRFLMPFAPMSNFSVFRLFATGQNAMVTQTQAPALHVSQEMTNVLPPREIAQPNPVSTPQNIAPEQVAAFMENDQEPAQRSRNWKNALPTIAAVVWLLGACYFLTRVIWGETVLIFRRNRWEKVTSSELLSMIDECSRNVKLRRRVSVYLTDDRIGAASCGIFRPIVLISRDMAETFSPEELRLVLLHEMLHHKRFDPLTHWLSQIAKSLHWPNPTVWLFMAKLRTERELAVDESVLRIAELNHEPDAASSYGNVILKTVRQYAMLHPAPGLLGVQSHDKFLERRITMILKSHKPSWWHLFIGVTILAGLALTGLTDAKPVAQEKPDEPKTATVAAEALTNTRHGYEIPDGTPEEMLLFCRKIWIGTVPQRGISKNFDEEYKAFVDCRRAILEAADKGLAQNPTGETRDHLIYQKSGALNTLAEREALYKTDALAEKIRDCEKFVEEVESRPEAPEVVKNVRGRYLELWSSIFYLQGGASREDFLQWREKVFEFLKKPENESYISLLTSSVLFAAQKIADRENDRTLAQETADMSQKLYLRSADEFNQSLAVRPQAILNKHYVEQDGLKIQGITFEGEKFDVATIKNKVVLVLFWNANRRTFYEIFPQLKAAYEKYHDKGLEIVGVCEYTDPDFMITFDETGKITSNAHQGIGMMLPSVVYPDYKNRSIRVTEFTPWKINISDKLTVDAGMTSPTEFYDAHGDYIFLVDENGKFLINSISQDWDTEKGQYVFTTVLDELFQSR